MNYVYTSARVSALWNELLTGDFLEQLIMAKNSEECVRLLNAAGFSGNRPQEIIKAAKERLASITNELFPDPSEIEVIFYEKIFHNAKAAVKRLYAKGGKESVYVDAPLSGETIENAVCDGNYDALPPYLKSAVKEAYETLLKTGDGQIADLLLDTACLRAMEAFGKETPHSILKEYVNESIAAADIKIAFRAKGEDMSAYMVDCSFFTAEAIARAAEEPKEFKEFLQKCGLGDVNLDEIDRWSGERILRALREKMHDMFSPAPAIAFVLFSERQISLLRLILICKEQGVSEDFIRRKAVRLYE